MDAFGWDAFDCFRLSELSKEDMEALEKEVDAEVKVQGGRSKPTIKDTVGYQLILLPISAYKVSPKLLRCTVFTSCSAWNILLHFGTGFSNSGVLQYVEAYFPGKCVGKEDPVKTSAVCTEHANAG